MPACLPAISAVCVSALTVLFVPCHVSDWLSRHTPKDSTLAVIASGQTLCIAPNSSSAGPDLALVICPSAPNGVDLLIAKFTLNDNARKQQLVHTASGKCVSAAEYPRAILAVCDAESAEQEWVFGASGRLCGEGGCLSVGS